MWFMAAIVMWMLIRGYCLKESVAKKERYTRVEEEDQDFEKTELALYISVGQKSKTA